MQLSKKSLSTFALILFFSAVAAVAQTPRGITPDASGRSMPSDSRTM